MSPFIKDTSVQAVLAAANIVDVVSGYTSLRKRGATYTGLCPFHQEKTPSFTVSADKGLYYCFGCGEGGDVVRFLDQMENLSFPEVIEQLGERFGVPVEFEEGRGQTLAAGTETRLLLVLEKAATFIRDSCGKQKAVAALAVSGETRLGGAGLPDVPGGLFCPTTGEDFTPERQKRASQIGNWRKPGCWSARREDLRSLPGAAHVPLVDHRGRVLGFGEGSKGRDSKYHPRGPLYPKGHLLYGSTRHGGLSLMRTRWWWSRDTRMSWDSCRRGGQRGRLHGDRAH